MDVLLITHVGGWSQKTSPKFIVCLNREGNQHQLGNHIFILDVLIITHVGGHGKQVLCNQIQSH